MPPETDNLELETLYQDDQRDRGKVYSTKDTLKELEKRDRSRRDKVYRMIESDQVRTKNDLYRAGVILYHGKHSTDFAAAHRLATLAAIMGHRMGRWILAASLDRFLMELGLAQIYGTQFEYNAAEKKYQLKLPIDSALTLSFEKEFLNIPSIPERLKALNSQLRAAQGVEKTPAVD